MKGVTLSAGFIPLVDAAPLIVAREMGFAATEGLDLHLLRAPSWSSLRDMLAFGQVDAAHMLAPVPVAMALGLGGMATPIDAVMVLSLNGTVIGVNATLAEIMREAGHGFGFDDATTAGRALAAAAPGGLRLGVPFPFSMHALLVRYWLGAIDPALQARIAIRTVPPPLMADALASGEIDAFCVGEPWGSIAVERGVGDLLLPGVAIWQSAPEKVLAVRRDWAETERSLLGRLMRACWRAGRWLALPGSRITAAEILARPGYLDMAPEIIDRALSGRLLVSPRGDQRAVPGFVGFHNSSVPFPWRSQAAWIGAQLAAQHGLDRGPSIAAAKAVFRSDLFRAEIAETGADMPGASEKLEGAVSEPTAVASGRGGLILAPDRFFDGAIFDPTG
ncbi:ABC transporter substrate-binding protein [Thalassococcus sp. CAU 1522]|uniref:ABC transporter substrate-binding protein n=1 Tax=Thalassococcus arenae TaxID=2851652 RepID=A0ABS6N9H1_9RHOB|nr:CmpA/NrtA family ABC transporter substrate-binding protein [Thalassococcus arenae]MBV2360618.1 ABC transporter substrate-binding protein [Thalassococcus arenae]